MFGYKSKARKRREKILTVTGWTIVVLFLVGVGETVYKVYSASSPEEDNSVNNYNEWSGRG